jgi:hypothetical protein
MHTPVEHASDVHAGSWSVTRDLSISFYQVRMRERCKAYYVIIDEDGRLLVPTGMQMGTRPAAELMDLITKVIGGVPGYAKDSPPVSVALRTHVDNLRGVATSAADASTFALWVDHRASQASATWNDRTPPAQRDVFCGIDCDYSAKTVCLTKKTVTKLTAARQAVSHRLPAGAICEVMGLLFFASQILKLDPSKYYFAMKTYRRLASQFAKGDQSARSAPLSLSPCVRRQLLAWIDEAIANQPIVPIDLSMVDKFSYILFCDASLSGWGAVLCNTTTNQVFSVGGAFEPSFSHLSINVLEAEAVLRGLYAFRNDLRGMRVSLVVDNTSCEAAVRRGYSGAYGLNKVVASINAAVAAHQISIVSSRYVNTRLNPADAASRGAPTNDDDARQLALLLTDPFPRLTGVGVLRRTCGGAGRTGTG